MAERKPCIRCQRQIDTYARICPYCNWDQSVAVPPTAAAQQETIQAYVPPEERDWRRYATIAGGAVLVLIAAFLVGMWINSDAAPKNAPEPVSEQKNTDLGRPSPRSDMHLVPDTEFEQPITSAPVTNPAQGVPNEYQRTDATAVSSAEYAQLVAQAKAEKKKPANIVDPRSLTGPAYAQGPQRTPPPMTSASAAPEDGRIVIRTRPVPLSQPLPDIRVQHDVTARLDLTIGPDGSVQEVNLRESIPGQTPKLIAAVQRWRFKPATENGVPVAAPFTVELSFRASE